MWGLLSRYCQRPLKGDNHVCKKKRKQTTSSLYWYFHQGIDKTYKNELILHGRIFLLLLNIFIFSMFASFYFTNHFVVSTKNWKEMFFEKANRCYIKPWYFLLFFSCRERLFTLTWCVLTSLQAADKEYKTNKIVFINWNISCRYST